MTEINKSNWLTRVKAAGIVVFGDETFRGQCDKEDKDLIEIFSELKHEFPLLSQLAIHIPNEGERTRAEAQKLRMKGALLKGAVDVFCPGNPSLVLELKRRDYTLSKIDPEQVKYLLRAQLTGAFTVVALGYDAAIEAIRHWISLSFPEGMSMEDPYRDY